MLTSTQLLSGARANSCMLMSGAWAMGPKLGYCVPIASPDTRARAHTQRRRGGSWL